MLSSIQFSKFKKSTNNGPKPPKVKNGGAYKYPKPVPTREERDLMESKARINNAKAAKLNREAQGSAQIHRAPVEREAHFSHYTQTNTYEIRSIGLQETELTRTLEVL